MNTEEGLILCRKLRSLKTPHREYVRVCREAYSQAALAQEGSVIMIVGPTRVGKSQVCRHLRERLTMPTSDRNPKDIPLICVEAATTDNGFFSMKHFTVRALQEIRHPIFGSFGEPALPGGYAVRMKETEQALRIALERGLEARSTRFLIVDEAHHLLRRKGHQRSHDILDSIKSLGNATGVVVILIGGYELLTAGLSSAHLNGRLKIVHFPRYKYTDDDMIVFDKVLRTISKLLPLAPGTTLLNFRDSIYAGTLGNIGLLYEWNEAAVAAMVADKSAHLELMHYQRTRFVNQLTQIQKDIEIGEAALQEVQIWRNEVPDAPDTSSDSNKKHVNGKPFTRKPTRDVVDR